MEAERLVSSIKLIAPWTGAGAPAHISSIRRSRAFAWFRHSSAFVVVHLGADATFQPVVIENVQFRSEPTVLFFQSLHFPVPGGLFVEIGFGNRLLEPLQNCCREY